MEQEDYICSLIRNDNPEMYSGDAKCEDDELPEDQRILKVISAVRKGELVFYTVLSKMSFHKLDDMVTWFYKK